MSKRQTLMLFGAIVIAFLFLGFPAFWDKMIAIFCGVVIIFIALRQKPEPVKAKKYSFVEHKAEPMDEMKKSTDVSAPTFDITKTETGLNS